MNFSVSVIAPRRLFALGRLAILAPERRHAPNRIVPNRLDAGSRIEVAPGGGRGRDGWRPLEHWQAMSDRHPVTPPPDRFLTYHDDVHTGYIVWLHNSGCPAAYTIHMFSLDESP